MYYLVIPSLVQLNIRICHMAYSTPYIYLNTIYM